MGTLIKDPALGKYIIDVDASGYSVKQEGSKGQMSRFNSFEDALRYIAELTMRVSAEEYTLREWTLKREEIYTAIKNAQQGPVLTPEAKMEEILAKYQEEQAASGTQMETAEVNPSIETANV